MSTTGYFPGKQTATPSKPKSAPAPSGGGGGSSSPTPLNVSPALREDIRAEREAANVARGVTSRSGGGSSSGSAAVNVDLVAAPKTPATISGSAARTTLPTTGQRIVSSQVEESFKAPASQFRTSGQGSGLIKKEYYNKAGEKVTVDYGSIEEQRAAKDVAKRQAKLSLLEDIRAEDKQVLRSGLLRQQSISQQLRSGLVRPEKVPELRAQLAKPAGPKPMAAGAGGVVTTSIHGGQPIQNLGYKISSPQRSADQIEKAEHPIKYHAKKYRSGIIKGVGAGMLGYAATQTAIISGGGVAAGATVSAVPATVAVATVGLGVGAYYGVREQKRKYDTFKEGGLGAVWDREKQRAKNWGVTAEKHSGAIVEGIAAVTFAVPTYISAQAYYSGGAAPVATGVDKGKITRTGPELSPTSKQVTTRSFKVGSEKYVVKAQTTAKENILPSLRATAQEKTKYTIYGVGSKGKLTQIKTVLGSGEVQLKPSGEFIRFQKVGDQTTQMSIGQMSRGGAKTTPRFIFESKTGGIRGFSYDPKYSSIGYVERVSSKPAPPIKPKPGQAMLPRINEKWMVQQASKEIIKPVKTKLAVTKIIKSKGGQIFAPSRPHANIVAPDTEIKPVFGSVPAAAPSVKPITFIGFDTALGSKAALVSAVLPGVSAGSLLAGGVAAGVAGASIEKSAAVNVARVGSVSYSVSAPRVSAGFSSIAEPISFVEPQTTTQPLTQPDVVAEINFITRPSPSQPIGAPGPMPFNLVPPEIPAGVPIPSLPPGGGFDSFSRSTRKAGRQLKGYTPSATAMAFGIKGKASQTGAKTGLGLRPIITPKKTKKGFRI